MNIYTYVHIFTVGGVETFHKLNICLLKHRQLDICETIRAVKTKMFDFEARVFIGWLANTVANQPIKTPAFFVFMLRWPAFFMANIDPINTHTAICIRIGSTTFQDLKIYESSANGGSIL